MPGDRPRRTGLLRRVTTRRCWACGERYSRRRRYCSHCKAAHLDWSGSRGGEAGFDPNHRG